MSATVTPWSRAKASSAARASRRGSLQARSTAVRTGVVTRTPSITHQSEGRRSRVPPWQSARSVGSWPRRTKDSRAGTVSSSAYRKTSMPWIHAAVRSHSTECGLITRRAARARMIVVSATSVRM